MRTQLQILKDVELELVKEFHRVCEENNLKYVLAFGTMLGCARHKGFIPWDDDIDVIMPWGDYCKFNKIANKVANDQYMVLNENTVKNYRFPFSKFVKKKSCAIFEYPIKFFSPQPIYIDVFPVLYVPKNKFRFNLIRSTNFLFGQIAKMKDLKTLKSKKRGWLEIVGMLLFYVMHKIIPHTLCKKICFKIASCVKQKDARACYVAEMYIIDMITRSQMPLDVFEDRILMEFEDTELYMPKNYDAILRNTYGDYMRVPPEDERKTHHFIYASDSIDCYEYDRQCSMSHKS